MGSTLAATPTKRPRRLFAGRLLAGLAVGLLFAAAFPPLSLPYLLPAAAAGLLAVLEGVTPRQAAYLGLACGMVFYGTTLSWLTNLFGAAAVSLWAICAAFAALFATLYVWLRQRLPCLPLWLLAPIVWTAVEVYRSEWFVLRFGWMGLGYAVIDVPALAAGAAWCGSYGLTFAIVALGAILLDPWRRRRRPGVLSAALLLAWLALFLMPRAVPDPSEPLTVRLVQAPSGDEESLVERSRPVPGRPVDLILWPEYSLDGDPIRESRLGQRLQRIVRENRCHLLLGAKDRFDPNNDAGFRNTAYLFAPDGRLVGRHIKNHTVHFFRDGVPGRDARAIPTALGRLGVGICFDMDYPDVARRLAADGAEVFLVPNMDPAEWGEKQRAQHRLMFCMRAAECGRWLARADVAGGTSVVAPTGQEVARVSSSDPVTLEATVGRETRLTPFVRGGWRFSQACLLMLGVCVLWSALPARIRAG